VNFQKLEGEITGKNLYQAIPFPKFNSKNSIFISKNSIIGNFVNFIYFQISISIPKIPLKIHFYFQKLQSSPRNMTIPIPKIPFISFIVSLNVYKVKEALKLSKYKLQLCQLNLV